MKVLKFLFPVLGCLVFSFYAMDNHKQLSLQEFYLRSHDNDNCERKEFNRLINTLPTELKDEMAPWIVLKNKQLWCETDTYYQEYPIFGAALSNDETWLALGSGSILTVLDRQKREQILQKDCRGMINVLSFSKDSKKLVVTCSGSVCIANLETGEQTDFLSGSHTTFLNSACCNHDETRLLTGSQDGVLCIFDVKTGQVMWQLNCGESVNSVSFDNSGKRIIAALKRSARIVDIATQRTLLSIPHKKFVCSALFNADETKMVTASFDGCVRTWDSKTGENLLCIDQKSVLYTASFSFDGAKIVTSAKNGLVSLWDSCTGRSLFSVKKEGIPNVAFLNASATKLVAAFSPDRYDSATAHIWQHYSTWSFQQALLYKLLSAWVLVKKPESSYVSMDLYLNSMAQDLNLDSDELAFVWATFPGFFQKFIWEKINTIIQRYGNE